MKGKHYLPCVLALIVCCYVVTLAYASDTDFDITSTYGYQQGFEDGYSEGYAQGYAEGGGDGSWASNTDSYNDSSSASREFKNPMDVAIALLNAIQNKDVNTFRVMTNSKTERVAETLLSSIYQKGTPYTLGELDLVVSYNAYGGNFEGVRGFLKTQESRIWYDCVVSIDLFYNAVRNVYSLDRLCTIGTSKGACYLYFENALD